MTDMRFFVTLTAMTQDDAFNRPTDYLTGRAVLLDLDVDADNNGAINEADDLLEEKPGGIQATGTVKQVTLKLAPAGLTGTLKLLAVSGGSRIRVWRDAGKTSALTLPAEWELSGGYTFPTALYVEGIDASAAVRDVHLCLRYTAAEDQYVDDGIRLTVLKVDLDIDVDDDGDVDETDESKEESPGAIVFENWDNDDGDAAHTPDKDKTSVTGENDLVPLYPKLEPTLTTGTLKLEATAGGSRVKVWTSATKGTEVTLPKTWDLTTETVPTTLYLEGYDESASANDIELKLSYANGGSSICDNKLKITVVRQNLGVASYRALASAIIIWLGGDFNHNGLIAGYTGKRTKSDLENDAKWVIVEMDGSACVQTTLQAHKAAASPFHGFYSVNDITDSQRNYVVTNGWLCLADGTIGYTWADAVDGDGIGLNWGGTIGDIDQLRCDGLVEVCYELANVEVWGRNGAHYLIQNFAEEHNDFGMDEPQTELCPIIQRGGVANSPTHFVSTVLFQPQTLP